MTQWAAAADMAPKNDVAISIIEHLAELRIRVIRSLIAVALGSVVAYIFYPSILDLILKPYCSLQGSNTQDCELLALSPLEGFSVRLTVASAGGLALAMPVILSQIWNFVTPGLYPKERRYGAIFVLCSLTLFFLGAALAYWSLPQAFAFLVHVGGESITNFYRPKEYVGFVVKMMIGAGIGFEFPIVLIFGQLIGLLKRETLRSARRYAIVGIVVLVAVLTPSGDPITLTVLSVPMYLFYEAAIIIGALLETRRQKTSTDTATSAQQTS